VVQRGGKREGAGRKPGYRLRKTAADVLADIEERHPGWSPLQLLAEIADNDQLDLAIRMDAAKCLAGFMHPKPKPAEFEPDQVIEFEKRLAEVKLAAAARAIERNPGLFGLGDRLSRASARTSLDAIIDDAPSSASPQDGEEQEEDELTALVQARPAADPMPSPEQNPEPMAEPYRPLLRPAARSDPAYDPHGNL
jgi:hypothetical protein